MQLAKIHADWSIHRRCEQSSCNCRQRVAVRHLYATTVPGPCGGSRKAAAFRCTKCAAQNLIATPLLPPRLLEQLTFQQRLSVLPIQAAPIGRNGSAWSAGKPGFAQLCADVRRAAAPGGRITAFKKNPADQLEQCSIALKHAHPGQMLSLLDKMQIELLIITVKDRSGHASQTIFHPRAGAAILVGGVERKVSPDALLELVPTTLRSTAYPAARIAA